MRNLLGYADLSFDAVAAIDVKTRGYQAEFGRVTGRVVNMVAKSASNEWHGEATLTYAQDSWDLTPNLTLQAGARLDQYDYKNRTGQSYIKLDDQIAPRRSFTWDPCGEGHPSLQLLGPPPPGPGSEKGRLLCGGGPNRLKLRH